LVRRLVSHTRCQLNETGSDAILKDANEEYKIIDFVHLVKIASE
jgi:hypothetical protein